MAIAHVATWLTDVGGANPGVSIVNQNPLVLSTAVNSTGSNFIVVTVSFYLNEGGTNASELLTVTDSKLNSYQRAGSRSANSNNDAVEIWYAENATGGTGHTITATFEAATYATMCGAAYSGLATSSVLDQTTGASGSGTTLASGSVTTSTADQLLIGAGTTTNSAASGFTPLDSFALKESYHNSGATTPGYLTDLIVSAISSYNARVSTDSGAWAARIATFTAPVVAAAAPTLYVIRSGIRLR